MSFNTAPRGASEHYCSRTANWLCVKHAPGSNIGNYVQYRQSNHLQYHFLSSIPAHSYTPKDDKVQNYCKPTAYTYSALYLFGVHNIAPTYFCSNGNVMYNNNKTHFLPTMCIFFVCNKRRYNAWKNQNIKIQMFSLQDYSTM
jgi:hypothetical protein